MEIYETIFRFLYNILSVYVGYRTIELFLVSKKIKWGKKFCLYFIVWLINSLLYVFSTGIIVVRISIIIGYLCFAFILYEGSWKMKILATVGAFALGLLSEDVVWIFSNLIGKPIEEEAMGCLCSGIFALLLLLLLERLKVFTKRASIPASGCGNLILLFLGSVFLAEIVTERMESYEWTMISLELICMINLGTYHIYHKVVENYEERIEKAEILQENRMYLKQLEILQQSRQNIRILRYVVCHKNEKAYQRLLEEQAGENRRFFYFIGAAQNEKYGKDMRLYQLSEVVSGKIDGCLKSLVQMQKKYFSVLARSGMLEGAIACVRDIVVFLYLIQKCAAQEISAAEFVLYYGIAMQFSNFVTVFVHSYSQLQTGSKGIEKIRTYMQEGEAPAGQQKTECTQKVECARAAEEISFQDVSFGYNTGRLVIDGLNLNIRKGEKLALIGENGAGKTTLVKLLCGLYPVSSGKITIQGTEVSRGQADFIRDQVAVLFQDALVLPYTVAENVSLKPLEETDQNQVWAALEQAGLSERIKQEPNGILTQMTKAVSGDGISLSGGEAQKLLMARMLYHKSAQIWILDEPTAALDAIAESEVYEKFRELGKEKTCIYISHRLASTQFMDRIILLKDGKIQESGTHKELMAQNRMYARLYEIQSRYYREEEQQ